MQFRISKADWRDMTPSQFSALQALVPTKAQPANARTQKVNKYLSNFENQLCNQKEQELWKASESIFTNQESSNFISTNFFNSHSAVLVEITDTMIKKRCIQIWANRMIVFSLKLWIRPVVPECAGCAMAHPDFGRSVNPISTRGDRLCPPN